MSIRDSAMAPEALSFPHESTKYQLDVQGEFHGSIIADAAYVGSSGRHLPVAMDTNQIPASLLSNFKGPGTNMAPYRSYTQYQSISAVLGEGVSHYDSLQARIHKQFSNSLQFASTFTYAHTLDDETGSGLGGPSARGDVWQNG